jgi:hypothetical protein
LYYYRTASSSIVEDERMEEGLENLLNLLEGVSRRRGSQQPQETPSDKLQYLSQLEMVARKLKHQIIQQTKVGISGLIADHGKEIRSYSRPR